MKKEKEVRSINIISIFIVIILIAAVLFTLSYVSESDKVFFSPRVEKFIAVQKTSETKEISCTPSQ